MIFNVRTWSFLCVRIHTGIGHIGSESAQHCRLGNKLSQLFLVLRTGFEPLDMESIGSGGRRSTTWATTSQLSEYTGMQCAQKGCCISDSPSFLARNTNRFSFWALFGKRTFFSKWKKYGVHRVGRKCRTNRLTVWNCVSSKELLLQMCFSSTVFAFFLFPCFLEFLQRPFWGWIKYYLILSSLPLFSIVLSFFLSFFLFVLSVFLSFFLSFFLFFRSYFLYLCVAYYSFLLYLFPFLPVFFAFFLLFPSFLYFVLTFFSLCPSSLFLSFPSKLSVLSSYYNLAFFLLSSSFLSFFISFLLSLIFIHVFFFCPLLWVVCLFFNYFCSLCI